MNRVYLKCNECGNVFSGRASPYGYKCVLCHSVNVTIITRQAYLKNKNMLKKAGGLKKVEFHCAECKHNFRVACPVGKKSPNKPVSCPRCGSDKTFEGWIKEEKEEVHPSTVATQLENFEVVP